ncbi:MAG: hypothetical protein WD512_18765, partial [Candidatus Paceibacterota bacterium]
MNRTIQKIFAWTLILLFFIIAPAIVLYSMGYRLSKNSNDGSILTSTGGVRINTRIPYDITINDKSESKSPLLKVGLAPQDLDVILSLPGYQPWAKKISVKPSLVQLISEVTLFPEKPNLEIFTDLSVARDINRVPDASSILYTSYIPKESGLWLLNLDTKLRKKITDSIALGGVENQDYSDYVWDSTGTILSFKTSINNIFQYFVIVNIDTDPVIFNITNLIPIADIIANPVQIVSLTTDRLFFTQAGNLYEIKQQFSNRSEPLVGDMEQYSFINDNIYYTSNKDTLKNIIRIYNIDTKQNSAIPLPDIAISKVFVSPNQGHIIVLDNKEKAWLKSIGAKTPEFNLISELKIKDIQFSIDSKKALLKGENIISKLYLDTVEGYRSRIEGDFDTLYTSKDSITKSEFWEPNSEYIMFIENNTLKIVESDTRGSINSYDLLSNTKNFISIRVGNDARTLSSNSEDIVKYFQFPI